MKHTGKTAGGIGAVSGGYGIYETTNSIDGFAVLTPLFAVSCVAIVVLSFAVFALWRRVKSLEGK
jgi:hypothetical protein